MTPREQMLARLDAARERYPAIYMIYDHPRDIPGAIVVRCWYGTTLHPDVFLAQTIDAARAYCERHGACVCLQRQPGDDPKIMESWI